MMEIRLNLYQADRDFQVEIGGGGFGYRLFGPKFDGSSRLIKSVILSERDKEEIVRFVNPDAEAVERENAELRLYKNATINQESAREKRIKELEAQLDAWQTVFGTSQLTHAQSRLEQAENAQAALAAAQGDNGKLREVIETMILFIPDGWQMPLGWNQVVAQAQEAFGGKP